MSDPHPIFGYILKGRVCFDRFENSGSSHDLAQSGHDLAGPLKRAPGWWAAVHQWEGSTLVSCLGST